MAGTEDAFQTPVTKPKARWHWGLLWLGIVVLANWPYQYEFVSEFGSNMRGSMFDFPGQRAAAPVMAGFPFRYWIRYPVSPTQPVEASQFSFQPLLFNAALSVAVGMMLLLYLRSRRRGASSIRYSVTIADLLLVTLLGAASFAWWRHVNSKQRERDELVQTILKHSGQVHHSAWGPRWLNRLLPQSMQQRHFRQVTIDYYTVDQDSVLLNSPYLDTLRISGKGDDLRLLDQLTNNIHLSDLRIRNRFVDTRFIEAIASCPRLRSLNLERTNVDDDSLPLLDSLTNLKGLGLIGTDVDLDNLGSRPWSRVIESLMVGNGQLASLTIEGWPKLTELKVNECGEKPNGTTMKVRLADLPLLADLRLDRCRKLNLSIRNAPKLEQIIPMDDSSYPFEGRRPTDIWLEQLDIDGAPALTQFDFHCVDTQRLRIRNVPNLQALQLSVHYDGRPNPLTAEKIEPQVAQALIKGIGDCDGPASVDLSNVPLDGVDLTPLTKNRGICRLNLSNTGTALPQWKQLEKMDWLTRIDLNDRLVDDIALAWILESFPKLEHLGLTPEQYSTKLPGGNVINFTMASVGIVNDGLRSALRIVDHQNLRSIDFGEPALPHPDRVAVINAPQLAITLQLGSPSLLQIDNAPALQGICIHGEIPTGAKIDGLRDQKTFAAGGTNLTDRLIAPLSRCATISTLTLAYPSITKEGLRSLSNLASLQSLYLPGTPLDDSIVAAWSGFDALINLNVSDTRVTGKSLRRLLQSPTLARISLDRTDVNPDELDALIDAERLRELSLVGIGIDGKTLDKIMRRGQLERLDLSDSEITVPVLKAIADHGSSLRLLGLRNCSLSIEYFSRVMVRYPDLVFDMGFADLPINLITELMAQRRISTREDWELRQTDRPTGSNRFFGFAGFPVGPAVIDIDVFAQAAQRRTP